MEENNLTNKRVIIFTKEKYRYTGVVRRISEGFLWFLDDNTKKDNLLPLDGISRVEISNSEKTSSKTGFLKEVEDG